MKSHCGLLKGLFLLKHHLCSGPWAASCQAGSMTSSQTQVWRKKALQPVSLAVWPLQWCAHYYVTTLIIWSVFPYVKEIISRIPPAWCIEIMILDMVCYQLCHLWPKLTVSFCLESIHELKVYHASRGVYWERVAGVCIHGTLSA